MKPPAIWMMKRQTRWRDDQLVRGQSDDIDDCEVPTQDLENRVARIDENWAIGEYVKASTTTVDGVAWIIVCVASLICLLDILLGINVIPLRDSAKPSKAVTLLLFAPLISFVLL